MSQTKCNAEPTARSTGLSLRRHNCQPLSTLNEHETNDRSIRLIRLHRHRSRDPLGDPQPRPPDEQTTAVEPLDGDVPTIILPNLLRTTEVSHADDSTKASPRHPQRTRNQRHMMRQINPTSLPFIPHPQQANVCKQSYRRTTDDHPLRLYNCQPATHNERETNATGASSEHSALDPSSAAGNVPTIISPTASNQSLTTTEHR